MYCQQVKGLPHVAGGAMVASEEDQAGHAGALKAHEDIKAAPL